MMKNLNEYDKYLKSIVYLSKINMGISDEVDGSIVVESNDVVEAAEEIKSIGVNSFLRRYSHDV